MDEKMWYIHKMEYYSALKKKGILFLMSHNVDEP